MLKEITLKDKAIFTRFLNSRQHQLSVYNFSNIFIWKKIFQIYWEIIEEQLCLFFRDRIGCFMYLAPLGAKPSSSVTQKCFTLMDRFNPNQIVSRIENVEKQDLPFYRNLNYQIQAKSSEYLYSRKDLVDLGGNKFKSKRSCINFFKKHYRFRYLSYSLKYQNSCLELYDRWMKERKQSHQGVLYLAMLADSRRCLEVLLKKCYDLDCCGRLVNIDKEVKAFTFGFKLNQATFCVLYEITDRAIKGLAQFIFQQFCKEMREFQQINIMDDSGLDNLKKTKLSYRPISLIPAYIVLRKLNH